MNILITGSAGFIGSNLAEELLARGHRVWGVDNHLSGQRRNTDRLRRHPGFTFVEADVSRSLPHHGPRLDWVLHLASPASPPHYQKHPLETLRVGAHGTLHALELASEQGASFLLASTSEVYGDPQVHPQPEWYWGHVNPNGPRSCYDEAKRYAEALTACFRDHYDLDTRIIRIFNTYGPHMRSDDGRVVTNFIRQALRGEPLTLYGDGEQTRSFGYIDDLVRGILRLMEVPYREPVNLGNPTETRIRELAELVRDMTGSPAPLVARPLPRDDPARRCPDIAVAERELGWRPRVALEEGLARTIEHFRDLESQAAD